MAGMEFGLTAREMNQLLKEHGFLYGAPGAYGLTANGKEYGDEQYHSRGTGGYALYNRNLETRTWSDETTVALCAAAEANVGGLATEDLLVGGEDVTEDESSDYGYHYDGDVDHAEDDTQLGWKELAVGAGILVPILGVTWVAPRATAFWNDKVKATVRNLRDKIANDEPDESAES